MTHERPHEGPSNIVGLNKYVKDSKRRVRTGLVQEQEWYIVRVINPESETIDEFAADILMRVVRVVKLKGGEIKVYAISAANDGSEEVGEDDATPMNGEGFFVDEGHELGYLLDVFKKGSKGLGALAAEAAVAA